MIVKSDTAFWLYCTLLQEYSIRYISPKVMVTPAWSTFRVRVSSVLANSYYFEGGGWLKDQSILLVLKTTSNKTEVKKGEGGWPFTLWLITAWSTLCVSNRAATKSPVYGMVPSSVHSRSDECLRIYRLVLWIITIIKIKFTVMITM